VVLVKLRRFHVDDPDDRIVSGRSAQRDSLGSTGSDLASVGSAYERTIVDYPRGNRVVHSGSEFRGDIRSAACDSILKDVTDDFGSIKQSCWNNQTSSEFDAHVRD
jgi:hypothetical protein